MQYSIQGEPKAGEHDAYCPGRDWGHIFEIGNPTQHQENGKEADHVQPQILERRNRIAYLSAIKKSNGPTWEFNQLPTLSKIIYSVIL